MHSIGRYTILGLLGRGGMGAVYKAAMPRTGRVVALKALRPSEDLAATADPETLRRDFFREAALMASLRHPNIAQVLDVDEAALSDGSTVPYFTMEYYCCNLGAQIGETYRVEAPTRRLGVDQALSCVRQLASALARLHAAGILHRDVKPYNLMLGERQDVPGALGSDEVKLIDFGLSRLRGEAQAPGRPKGAVVGSPYYAAPEQEADPEAADERADVFGAGVTLFRLLTGGLPQESGPASTLRQGLDERFDVFFLRVCNVDPGQRPPSARALLAELDDLALHWRRLREQVCALPEEANPCPTAMAPAKPRSSPVRQALAGARERFGLDALWRPERCGDPSRFVAQGDGTVRDPDTGLLWEQGGSDYPVTWAGAAAHVQSLDAVDFGGRSGWRLPTAEELATLLTPEPAPRMLCLAPVFAADRRRLWSADRKSFAAAWYADAEHGFLWWQDLTCEFHARGVCSGESGG